MGKKNKNKKKKVNPKKERYAKYRKDKPSTMTIVETADVTPEMQKQRQEDEFRINKFMRFNRNPDAKELWEKKDKYK